MEVSPARRRPARAAGGTCSAFVVDEEAVASVQEAMPPDEVLRRVADEFAALSDPTRLKLLLALSQRELCVCELASVTERSMPAVSQQLQRMRRMGLVDYRMSGKLSYYRLVSPLVRRTLRAAIRRCDPDSA